MKDTNYNTHNVHVCTPPALYAALDSLHHFDYDPCPLNCKEDLFSKPWGECNFVNPPYKEIVRWVERGLAQRKKCVFLIPFRGDRFYWHRLIWPNASQVTQLMGGIRFGDYKQAFPGPMAIVVFDPVHAPGPITRASFIVHPYQNRPALHLHA